MSSGPDKHPSACFPKTGHVSFFAFFFYDDLFFCSFFDFYLSIDDFYTPPSLSLPYVPSTVPLVHPKVPLDWPSYLSIQL